MKLLIRSLPRENNNMKNHSLWYGYKYYRSTLTVAEKKIYDAIYNGLKMCSSEISVPPISPDKCSKLLDGVSYDTPMFYHVEGYSLVSSLFGCKILPRYRMTAVQYQMYFSQLQVALDGILDFCRNGSTLDAIKTLHDYILDTIKYEEFGSNAHSIIGPMISHKGVCEAISKFVKISCDQLNIASAVVIGSASEGPGMPEEHHAWNAIQIANEWYLFDFTFDLTLNESNPCQSIRRYDYFGLSSYEMSIDHHATVAMFPPSSVKRDYFTLCRAIVHNQNELQELIRAKISLSNRDLAFRVSNSWFDFVPENALKRALSVKMALATRMSIGYTFTYNEQQRVCYVRFS